MKPEKKKPCEGDSENPCPDKNWIVVIKNAKRCASCFKAYRKVHSRNYQKMYGKIRLERQREAENAADLDAMEAIPEMGNPKASSKFIDQLINIV